MVKTEERHYVYNFIYRTVVNKISSKINMVGNKYGKLTVLEMIYNDKRKQFSHCKCMCDCGNIVTKSSYELRKPKSGKVPSCGCDMTLYKREKFSKRLIGNKYGKLTVLEEIWGYPVEQNTLKCLCDCGNIVTASRADVISGHTRSCGCLQKEQARNARFVDSSGFISDFGIKIILPYKRNSNGTMLWKCLCSCGNTFYEVPARIKNNHVRSCGCINMSSMEQYIKHYLDDNNIQYIQQYTFCDCTNSSGNKLRFDFAIMKNDELYCLIEYDGLLHFLSVEYFGGDTAFLVRCEYDHIKDEYCKSNNILLLRLPYYLSKDEIKQNIINIMNPLRLQDAHGDMCIEVSPL